MARSTPTSSLPEASTPSGNSARTAHLALTRASATQSAYPRDSALLAQTALATRSATQSAYSSDLAQTAHSALAGPNLRAAIYARVSTLDQEPENQLAELRQYVGARGWTGVEYVDQGVSGAKERRLELDRMIADARRRRFDVLVCWRLDRLGRNLKHLVTLLDELQALGVSFVSLNEGIDATTPAGRLQLHILAALAEFERSRIAERVQAGLARARKQGKRLGRPRSIRLPTHLPKGFTVRQAATGLDPVSWAVELSC